MFGPTILMTCLVLFFAVMFILANRAAQKWEVTAEGAFSHVEYSKHTYTHRSGAMVHTESEETTDLTTVYFIDGQTQVLTGRHDMAYPVGTKLRIWRNGLGHYRVERVANERKTKKICTKVHPFTPPLKDGEYWEHEDATEKFPEHDFKIVVYHCPNCGLDIEVDMS